jgi:hypothetical protein
VADFRVARAILEQVSETRGPFLLCATYLREEAIVFVTSDCEMTSSAVSPPLVPTPASDVIGARPSCKRSGGVHLLCEGESVGQAGEGSWEGAIVLNYASLERLH